MASDDYAKRPQDPLVERLRPDPSQPAERVKTLAGFLGDSDREGYRRLYFTRDLDHYAEFRAEDVLHAASIAAGSPPFVGEDATRVSLRRAATVEFTRVATAAAVDEFDIQLRIGGDDTWRPPLPITDYNDPLCDTGPATPGSCAETCQTCPTNCGSCYEGCTVSCADTCVTRCGTCVGATCEGTCVADGCEG